jgi:hypothetical protein
MFASKDTLLTRPSGGYNIARSVRLRSSASAYFSRTPASNGNRQIFTWSGWVKRGTLGSRVALFNSGDTGSGVLNGIQIIFFGDNTIQASATGGTTINISTNAVYRDPSAWYHIVFAVDTTQATSSNRVKIYVNGSQVTSFSTATYPSQNQNFDINNTGFPMKIGASVDTATTVYYYDGYMTEINYVDGQQLTPSSFGETDSITGVWKPKAYSGTYGTNGFELNFSDNSASTAATIGKDYSGNGNNWTPNNISVTTGATYDSMTDVPTLTSATAANYAVSNINDIDRANITTSNGNLTLTKALANDSPRAAATFGATSGKYYAEITWTSVTNTTPNDNYIVTGVTTKENWTDSSNGYNNIYYLAANNGLAIAGNKGGFTAGSFNGYATYGSNYFASGNVIGIALNLDAGTVTFYLNNTSQGAITLPTTAQPWFFYNTSDGTGNAYTANWNFGQQPFTYTPPTGFVALNTYNLPASTITNGAAYMAATLYTGNSPSSQTVSNAVNSVSFQPDLVWQKSRTQTYSNVLYDSVRGVQKRLSSNETAAESTASTAVTAFTSSGFTTGADGEMNDPTGGSNNHIAWMWKAGTTSASNTNGSITSTVSAGATQGFSVVTYTGTGANATVGHGLGVAPSMIIVKSRSTAGTDWPVYHSSLGATGILALDATIAFTVISTPWNNTAPTSSVFSVGTSGDTNLSARTYVAYCFSAVAGYSAFGSYTGNGSTDGPFVYLGFRPRFVMFKLSSGVNNWLIMDSSRNTYNVADLYLAPNLSDAEASYSVVDFLSNGFKIRNTSTGWNGSGSTYIYACFAEVPFRSALAR